MKINNEPFSIHTIHSIISGVVTVIKLFPLRKTCIFLSSKTYSRNGGLCGFEKSRENPKWSIISLGWQAEDVLDDFLRPPVPINPTCIMSTQLKHTLYIKCAVEQTAWGITDLLGRLIF